MRSWKLALGLAFLLGVGIWGLATLGHQPRSQGTGVKFPSFSKIAQTAADQGVIQPTGKPEFTATFTGSRLKKSVWATCYPAMDLPTGCTYFGSSEYQWYLPSQDRVSGGVLRLTAQRAPTAGKARNGRRHEYACRSGMVTTYPSFRFTFGYVQVSAKILPRPGLRPALWLAAANGASQPKIAMLQAWGGKRGRSATAAVTFEPVGHSAFRAPLPSTLAVGWHTIALSWKKAQLTWLVDGKQVLTVRQQIPQQQMYFIADLAEFSYPRQADECNGSLLIRSVKVWKD
jgi:beta-glucanase (GH16 family)